MADRYTAPNAIPERVIVAALHAYAETSEPIASICARFKLSASTLNHERRARGVAIRPHTNRKGGRPRTGPRASVYLPEPQTEMQRKVRAILQRNPNATMEAVAAEAGCSKTYVSRLRLHWEEPL